MRIRIAICGTLCLLAAFHAAGQTWPLDDHWYENPLGFKPVELHTKNGFLLPALAVGICLLTTSADSSFLKEIDVFDEAGLSWGYKYPSTRLIQNDFGFQVFLRSWLAVGVDAGVYWPHDAFNNAIGIAIRPFARFFPVHSGSWRLFFESGGGLIRFFEEFPKPTDRDPRLGTLWNGTTRYGLGGDVRLGPSCSLLFGIRHVHVSNGNTNGVERNPSHDSNGFYLGITWKLKP